MTSRIAVRNLKNQIGQPTDGNPANESLSRLLREVQCSIIPGVITRMGVGAYDCVVETAENPELTCVCASSILPSRPHLLGAAEAAVYSEGNFVVVLKTSLNFGVIICPFPLSTLGGDFISNGKIIQRQIFPETEVSQNTEKAFTDNTLIADNLRPIDLVQGDITWLNELLVGIGVLKLTTFIQASDRAKLELFTFDDHVRLTSGLFQHLSSASNETIYNDNGYNTRELIGSHHQCEMAGRNSYTPYLEPTDPSDPEKNDTTNLKYSGDITNPYLLGRYHSYLGHLGGIFSFFIGNPQLQEGKSGVELPDETNDQGMFHTTIDGAGRLLVRSAGGICLQRTDKIAIPKKINVPWQAKAGNNTSKTPFKWDDKYPYSRHLRIRDLFSWETASAYLRFIESPMYYLPAPSDLKDLDDKYDFVTDEAGEMVLGQSDFTKPEHKNASSYFQMDKDGSIIIRGKYGEEICLAGGNITISCPGNIELRPGKSTVILSGTDTIVKSKNSTDISSTDKDVRIKAEKNLHIYSKDGGILLESDASVDTQLYDERTGESVVSSGIVLKATKSKIFTWAKKVHTAFEESGIIEAIKQKTNAFFSLFVPRFMVFSDGSGVLLKTADAVLQLTNNQATLAGNTAYLSGSASSGVFKGSKYLVPVEEAPMGMNPHATIQEAASKIEDQLTEEDYATSLGLDYIPGNRDSIKFTFRSSEQYNTTKPWQLGVGDGFYIYESSWAFLSRVEADVTKDITTDNWKESGANETYPWPGELYYNSENSTPCIVTLTSEAYVDKDGLMVDYAKILPVGEDGESDTKPGKLEVVSIDELTVAK